MVKGLVYLNQELVDVTQENNALSQVTIGEQI